MWSCCHTAARRLNLKTPLTPNLDGPLREPCSGLLNQTDSIDRAPLPRWIYSQIQQTIPLPGTTDCRWAPDVAPARVPRVSRIPELPLSLRVPQRTRSLQTLVSICTAALDAVASPLCAVRSDGRMLFANRAFESFLRSGRWLGMREGRISSCILCDSTLAFETGLERLRSGVGSTILVTDRQNGKQAIVAISPIVISNGKDDAVSDRLGVVSLTTSESDLIPVKQLAQLFNLTPAEQNLVSELVVGAGLRAVAVRLNISIHTARNQLKAVLSKTGRHSQAQLLTLVTRMASLRLPEQD
jgi:DNA-binding CsgD family transcriptional regulator